MGKPKDEESGLEESLPTIEEMRGLVPDFLGGLTMQEFFDEMYDEYPHHSPSTRVEE